MIKIGDIVKVTGKTDCGGFETECIKIGTFCRVVETYIDEKIGLIVGIDPIDENNPTTFWYSIKDIEKCCVIEKTMNITINIEIARKMLNVAGYETQSMSDGEVFDLALSMNEEYGVSYDGRSGRIL